MSLNKDDEMKVDSVDEEVIDNDDIDDTSPVFIDLSTAVEVNVDDEMEPMDSDNEDDNVVEVADEEEGKVNREIQDMSKYRMDVHKDSVYCVAIDKDGKTIASGGGDDVAYLHILEEEGDKVKSQKLEHDHSDSVSSIAFNTAYTDADPKNHLLAVASYDGTIQLYNRHDVTKSKSLEGPTDVEWIAWHPKGGTVLLSGSTDGTLWMYHTPSSKCLQVFVGHQNDVSTGRFTPDGKLALSAGVDSTLRIWAPKTGLCRHSFTLSARVTCMDVYNHLVLCGCEDGTAALVHYKNKKILTTLRHVDHHAPQDQEEEEGISIEAVGFCTNPNFHWCATAGLDSTLKIWDLSETQCRMICTHENNAVITKLKWHPIHPIVFTAASDGCVRLWDARNGACLICLIGHTDTINDMDICFLDGGKNALVVTGSDDFTVRVFEVNIESIFHA